ncbi:tetratricopeptide repeat protein [Cetobacterium sp. 8H]|uniref:tetratricopeptide repeat protein n=1 Tax=Cetobacterium sp. 8H TaxID=2759681 RepID=UPI00163C5825|nr:tetratricopeptide repeat protein [Cetobacterium sp. 8H]MBC2851281.1 tetratricopeptide repeat protein [Cetobacterium sp. 8H]
MLRKKILKRANINKEQLLELEQEIRFTLLSKPNDIDNLDRLGMILFYKRDCQGSLEIYEKLRVLGKKDSETLGFLGYLNYELGNYTQAITYFNMFLDKKPGDAFVYFLLGNAYSRAGKIIEAINSYDFAIFLDLDIYKAHLDFAEEYESLGRDKKALVEYIAAYEIDPRNKNIEVKINELKKKIKDIENRG